MSTFTTFRAPGRVNLIGDHTDYQDGLCLPMAIDRDVRVECTNRADGRVRVTSDDFVGRVDLPADGSLPAAQAEPEWGRVVAAVLSLVHESGRAVPGFDADIRSTVPPGSGLSSSAAVEVALALTCSTLAGDALEGNELAVHLAEAAEHLATGMPCGVMDQMAVVHGRAGHALVLDCRTLRAEPVPLSPTLEVFVVHSGLARQLEASAYVQRRAACEAAATRLGVATLRDASAAQVADDPIARHVVSENARVIVFARALHREQYDECGRLMLASHASLRDDFVVSTEELDLLVVLATANGALGARLTGAGFGGCIVGIAEAGRADSIGEAVAARYLAETGLTPLAFTVQAADGAGAVEA